MNKLKHTPGPWTVEPFKRKDGQGFAVCHNGDKPIAWVYQASPNAFGDMRGVPLDQFANAKLMAASPDLLAALQYLDSQIPEKITGELCVTVQLLTAIAHVRAAIAKATGGDE